MNQFDQLIDEAAHAWRTFREACEQAHDVAESGESPGIAQIEELARARAEADEIDADADLAEEDEIDAAAS
jgi:hypothetical protein